MSPAKVTLLKADGRQFQEVDASLHTGQIFFNDPELPLEVGDIVQHQRPGGIVDEFVIVDPNFMTGLGGRIPAHFQSKVTRRDKPLASHDDARTITYHLHGANSRVNIQSSDNSLNLTLTADTLFSVLKTFVQKEIEEPDRSAILATVVEMENADKGTAFREKYLQFVSVAADHLGVLSAFLPMLANLLNR